MLPEAVRRGTRGGEHNLQLCPKRKPVRISGSKIKWILTALHIVFILGGSDTGHTLAKTL